MSLQKLLDRVKVLSGQGDDFSCWSGSEKEDRPHQIAPAAEGQLLGRVMAEQQRRVPDVVADIGLIKAGQEFCGPAKREDGQL